MELKKLTLSNIRELIYIGTIIVAGVMFFVNKGKKDAIIETQLQTVIKNQDNILNWMKQEDFKNEKQAELNGKIITYIELLGSD